jgi:hypothetical protein
MRSQNQELGPDSPACQSTIQKITSDIAEPFLKSKLGNKCLLTAMEYFITWKEVHTKQEVSTMAVMSQWPIPSVALESQDSCTVTRDRNSSLGSCKRQWNIRE